MTRPVMSAGQLITYLIEDNRRRRKLLNKSTAPFGVFCGFFSHISICISLYRLSHYFFCKRLGIISKIFYVMNIMLFGCDISPMTNIGPGLVIFHPIGITIHAKIGKNALLHGQNGIGGTGGRSDIGWFGGPVVSDNLTMYFGAKIIAHVEIGNNVAVGAAALVLDAVPDNKLVAGIPAKIIRENTAQDKRYGG